MGERPFSACFLEASPVGTNLRERYGEKKWSGAKKKGKKTKGQRGRIGQGMGVVGRKF